MTAITIKKGNDFQVTRFITDSAGAAIDLTGQVVTSEVRPTAESPTLHGTLTVAIVNAAAGAVTLSATAAETDVMPVGQHKYDIKRTDNANIVRNSNVFGFTVQGVVTDV